MSALVCLSREGGRSDRAASLSDLASGSLAASAVCSAGEREAEREEGDIKARQEAGGVKGEESVRKTKINSKK